MKVLCIFLRYNYGESSRGVSIDYTSFVPAIESMGHEVLHFDSWDRAYGSYAEMNRAMLQTVQDWKPDLIFTVQRDYEIFVETLQAIAALNGPALVTWTTDDSFKFHKYSRFIAPYYDATSTTYDYRLKDYQDAGIDGVILTQWAANAFWLQAPKPAAECRYDVSFVGTKYGEREAIAQHLQSAGINVTCFGYGWPNGPVDTEDIPRIMRDSRISLNFSSGFKAVEGHTLQLKARTFEVPGAGGFLLSDPAPRIEEFYRIGEEIDTFDSPEALVRKVRFYLEHPDIRDRMAEAAFQRTRNEHLYAIRLQPIFELALQRKQLRLNGRGDITTFIKTRDALGTPKLNLAETLWKTIALFLCQRVWGRERGLKAARRLTFEISVRVFGARTFTRQSLPARLFPFV